MKRWLIWLLLCLTAFAQTTVTTGGGFKATSSVLVTWDASAGAASYNVYRGEVSGGPYAKISSGVSCCLFRDVGTQPQHTYYYTVSAVDGSNNESAKSAETNAAQVH